MDPVEPGVSPVDVDVLVVGAGISGICAAHALLTTCPGRTFAVLEGRERLGGTWDLFRYPGIRSDSDMYTLGYSFRPWRNPEAIADGPAILAYLDETARETGIADHIRYRRQVESVSWSSADARWTVRARRGEDGGVDVYRCSFLWVCAGYYRYDRGYTPELPGRERFGGAIVHPQRWPEGLEVRGKRVVVIGSGATAVTLVPSLAELGADVVMLQRSPTYIVSVPTEDAVAERLKAWLPAPTAHRLVRWKNIAGGTAFYQFCRRFPGAARRLVRRGVRQGVGPDVDLRAFEPAYEPWDQRLCLVPDGDLFRAVRAGRARVVTGRIATFTESGLALESGEELPADLVVTATGLELQFLGGARVEVDGEVVDPHSTRIYMGTMLTGVPNAAFVLGYTNASWTLKCELVCDYVARLIRHMGDRGYRRAVPRRDPTVEDRPAIEMSSGYFRRALDRLPTQGTADPWRLHQDYFTDRRLYRRHPIEDGVLDFA